MDLRMLQIPAILSPSSSSEFLNIKLNAKQYGASVVFTPTLRLSRRVPNQSFSSVVKQRNHKVLCYHGQEVLEKRSMQEVYDALAERLLPHAMKDQKNKYIVGLAGPPGAGKSTVASEVVIRLNRLWSEKSSNGDSEPSCDVATILPMDGFHLYRSQLDAMKDPKEAHARRGAPWTFNPELLLQCLSTLQREGSVYAPSFDHGVGDPVENDIFVSKAHKIVIVEGNYVHLEDGIWDQISAIFNEKWFIDIDINTAMQRVLKRHIATGKKPDVAQWRIEYNDRPNAELIMKSKKKADLIIRSVELN